MGDLTRGEDMAAVLPAPPVPLRPMTVADLLDGSFEILKRRPRAVITIALATVLPVQVVSVLLARDLLDSSLLLSFSDPSTSTSTTATALSWGIGAVSLALLTGAVAVLVDGWYRGIDVSPGQAIVASLRRSPALVVAVVLVHLLEAVGLLAFGVGSYAAMALCHVTSPAVTVERLGPVAAIARSVGLTRRRFGMSLLVPGLAGVVSFCVGAGFQAIPDLGAAIVGEDWAWAVRAAGQLGAQLVTAPFVAGVAVLFHLDLRMRIEAIDIEMRSDAVLAG